MTKTNRNATCPCGSGKKYKKCCLPKDEIERKTAQAAESPDSGPPVSYKNAGSTKIDKQQKTQMDKLWDKFEKSSLDLRLEIAREAIETMEDLDGE